MSILLAFAATVAPPLPLAPSQSTVQRHPTRPVSQTMTYDVELRSDAELLWSGQMRVSERMGATFSQQQQNAAPLNCMSPEIYGEVHERSVVSINLSPMSRFPATGALNVRVTWERPGSGAGCPARMGSRSVSITQILALQEGQQQTLTGDGGLTIRLRRR
ncbi:hypothetical protein ABVV53_04655 [Novosphingobium sp. RD2P27]|uniref:Uncharacterized protein n=1 Tax=Novosphingobium kalidii TaxID=3230299 RepID=A0ABV2CYS0_9SPHN